MNQQAKGLFAGESGSVAVSVAVVLVVLLGISAVTVDYGHLTSVSRELKKAAEAGALAGAKTLAPYTGVPPHPNWSLVQTTATQTVLLNRVDKQTLSDCQVEYGWWNLITNQLDPVGTIPTASHLPAAQVTVAKAAGHNGGPIQMFFAPIFGVKTRDLSARAVAVISFPRGMPVGALFPLAAAKTIVDQYWTLNPPVSFKIGSGSTNGQWTSFMANESSASYVAGLISGGNPAALNLNDNIYIQTGVEASNYGNADSAVGRTVVIALVASLDSSTAQPVIGFVAFQIESVHQGSKYIQGHFDKDFNISNASTIGPPTPNTLSTPNPPKLVY